MWDWEQTEGGASPGSSLVTAMCGIYHGWPEPARSRSFGGGHQGLYGGERLPAPSEMHRIRGSEPPDYIVEGEHGRMERGRNQE
jgi:hypothetical protein